MIEHKQIVCAWCNEGLLFEKGWDKKRGGGGFPTQTGGNVTSTSTRIRFGALASFFRSPSSSTFFYLPKCVGNKKENKPLAGFNSHISLTNALAIRMRLISLTLIRSRNWTSQKKKKCCDVDINPSLCLSLSS